MAENAFLSAARYSDQPLNPDAADVQPSAINALLDQWRAWRDGNAEATRNAWAGFTRGPETGFAVTPEMINAAAGLASVGPGKLDMSNAARMLYRGTPMSEAVPQPRDFPGSFFSFDPGAAAQYGEHVTPYQLPEGAKLLQFDLNPSSEAAGLVRSHLGGIQLKPDELEDEMANLFMFPTPEWRAHVQPFGYAGTQLGSDAFLFDPASALPMSNAARMARAQQLGYTVPAYHGTLGPSDYHPSPNGIEAFGPDTHFGSAEAANDRLRHLTDRTSPRTDGIHPDMGADQPALYPVLLRVRKPYQTGDLGEFHDADVATDMFERGLLSEQDLQRVYNGELDPRDVLRQRGYDAIRYTNAFEDPGSYSYMMLDPSGVRSHFAAFDPRQARSPNILAGGLPLALLPAAGGDDGR
jgi:hypothetical protein